MNLTEIKQNVEQKMRGSIDALKSELAKIRTGRAHTGLLDHILIDYYGTKTALPQVAGVTLADAHTINVQPWEKPLIQQIEKAIRDSGLGLNPSTSGDSVRVPMPRPTEERRQELAKVVHHEGENAKLSVRNLRRDANEQLKKLVKDKEISEDDERRAEKVVQELTDKFIVEIDKLISTKRSEIMTV